MELEEAEKPKEEIKSDEKKEGDMNEDENVVLDYKTLYFSHPSQLKKKKKDFTEYTRVDMKLLNKKRERKADIAENNKNEKKIKDEENINLVKEEEKKDEEENKKDTNDNINIEKNDNSDNKKKEELDLENNLPKELLEFIEIRKNKTKFTASDFEKYKIYKNLVINFGK